jgi:hypothetical protein
MFGPVVSGKQDIDLRATVNMGVKKSKRRCGKVPIGLGRRLTVI